jgi:integrase
VFEARDAPTVRDLVERYIEQHLPRKRPRSQRDDRSMIKVWLLPELGDRRVADIKLLDVEKLHRRITQHGAPIRANRVASLLSTMLNLAVKAEWISANPAHGVTKNPEVRRERFLSQEELGRLTAVLATYPKRDAAAAIMLLVLTGSRRNEVLGATWGEFDLERGTWTRAAERMKGKRAHTIPLSAPALALLAELKIREGTHPNFLFPAPGRAGRLVDIKRQWDQVREAAGLPGVRLHDLRHSYASFAVSHGLSLPVIGALLAHRSPATTARYSHLHDAATRDATERVGQIVTGGGEVVPIRRQK